MKKDNFNQEFSKVTRYLRGFAFQLTKDSHLAEDLYQDTAMQVYRHKDNFREGTNMKAWSGVIMRNTFINQYRRKKRRGEVFDSSESSYIINGKKDKIGNAGEGNILYRELMVLVEKLEEGLKQPFVMAYEGYRYEEIAQQMHLPIGTVKSRIFQARKRLKNHIFQIYNSKSSWELAA